MLPFHRPYTTFYWFAIVIVAISVPCLSYLTLNDIMTLKSGFEVTQGQVLCVVDKVYGVTQLRDSVYIVCLIFVPYFFIRESDIHVQA